jgi:hypothetical protein
MQTKLANLLLAYGPLAALIGNRIHWDMLPQGSAQPAVVMFVVSGVTDYTMSGASGYVMTRVQFDSRGRTAAEARSVAEAIRQRLSGFRGVFQGYQFQGCFEAGQRTRHDKDGPALWFTDSRDYQIHWAPA